MISKCCTWTNVERCLLLISIPTYVPLLWLYVGLTVCSWWKMTLCSRLKICWKSLGHLQQKPNVWYWFHNCFDGMVFWILNEKEKLRRLGPSVWGKDSQEKQRIIIKLFHQSLMEVMLDIWLKSTWKEFICWWVDKSKPNK